MNASELGNHFRSQQAAAPQVAPRTTDIKQAPLLRQLDVVAVDLNGLTFSQAQAAIRGELQGTGAGQPERRLVDIHFHSTYCLIFFSQ